MRKELEIVNKLGLHARAAAKLVSTASRFGAQITVRRDDREANGKSIMSVMMLAASQGTRVSVEAQGDDASEALCAIEALVADRFGESE